MVINAQAPWLPLGSALGVFTGVSARLHAAVLVFIALGAGVPVIHQNATARVVGHDVLVVDHAPVFRPHSEHEVAELLIADAGLAEVYHAHLEAGLDQVKACQKCHSRSETVTSSLDPSRWVKTFETGDLGQNVGKDLLFGRLEAAVNLAVAIWIAPVLLFVDAQVCEPVAKIFGATEGHVDGVV